MTSEICEKQYTQDPELKKDDVQAIYEWLKKQPHLPEMTELQVILFLQSCYYSIERAKTAIDNYFTVRTDFPELFDYANEEIIEQTLSVEFMDILPRKTPEGYIILSCKLLDYKPENYVCINHLKVAVMILTLYLHKNGPVNGFVLLSDEKGATFGHLARANFTAVRKLLFFIQEAAPIRVKGIQFVNVVPMTEKLMSLIKPFLSKEIVEMVRFHSSLDSLYKEIPKECLPEDYGGDLDSIQVLRAKTVEYLVENLSFFKWHDGQKVEESKRMGKPSGINANFGVDGTFKKLEID